MRCAPAALVLYWTAAQLMRGVGPQTSRHCAARETAFLTTQATPMKLHAKQCIGGAIAISTCASFVGAQTSRRDHWIATWTASTFQVPPRNVQQVAGQTIRQVATITLGGERVRIRLSNEYGDRPLKIGTASVALADTEATIIDGSSRGITFGGQASIVVRPGAVIVSDPVVWRVRSFASVAVSLFVPDTAFISTLAVASPQLTYFSASGNFAAGPVFPVDSRRAAWMFLNGIDVDNRQARGGVVVLGSSSTGGSGPGISAGARWPDVLARRLHRTPQGSTMSVLTATINGNELLANHRTSPALGRFNRDVLGQPGITHVIVLEGNNDIAQGIADPRAGVTATDIIFGLTQIATRARDHGLTAIVGTLPPFEGGSYNGPAGSSSYGPEAEAIRRDVNIWIRRNTVFDGVIDFDACVRDPVRQSRLRQTYDYGDHVHFNDAGYRAMGECVDLRLFSGVRR